MGIQLLKRNRETDVDMDSYKKNLRRHRLKYVVTVLAVLLVLAAGVVGIRVHMENKTYLTYEVAESFARTDTMMTQYTEFQDYVLKYVKELPEYKGLPVVLMGHSWGAFCVCNILNFHPEILPTPFAISIAASREGITFSTVTEIVLIK